MSKNNDIIEDFKKSLSATIKSIGKKEDIEINFVKENPSIIGNTINPVSYTHLTLPTIHRV